MTTRARRAWILRLMPAVSLAVASAVFNASVRGEAANAPRFTVAFDFLALFNPDSIVAEGAREPLP